MTLRVFLVACGTGSYLFRVLSTFGTLSQIALSLVLSSPVSRLAARFSAAAAGFQRHTARRGEVFFCSRRLLLSVLQLCSLSTFLRVRSRLYQRSLLSLLPFVKAFGFVTDS